MSEAPEPTALYRVFDADDMLLYIGISGDFGTRWKQHARIQPWWGEKQRLTVEWLASRELAEAAETAAIKAEKPAHNKRDAVTLPPPARETALLPLAPQAHSPRRREWGDSPPWPFSLPYVRDAATAAALAATPGLGELDPGTPEEQAAAGAAFWSAGWREWARTWHQARRTLELLREVEQCQDLAHLRPQVRRLRARIIEMTTGSCPCCEGKPPAAMRCMACGAEDPAFSAAEPGTAESAA
jgi:predicted GIY-YIG superfamily endonuclease